MIDEDGEEDIEEDETDRDRELTGLINIIHPSKRSLYINRCLVVNFIK